MAKIEEGAGVAGRFAGVLTKKVQQLTPTERKARGLLRALADSTAARDRAAEASAHHEAQAKLYQGQVQELSAALAALPEEAAEGDGGE
jgi:hypothetical protein